MGGVIGAVSGKFVLAATGLLMSATVERQKVRVWIDPASEVSQVSERVAARIEKVDQSGTRGDVLKLGHPVKIGIGAKNIAVDRLAVADKPLGNGVDMVIGRDILENHRFELNFRSSRISIIPSFDYKNATRSMTPVALVPGPDGTWRFSATIVGSAPATAVLQLASPHAVTFNRLPVPAPSAGAGPVNIGIGGTMLSISDVALVPSPGPESVIRVGLKAFVGRRIILDLPHRTLWIDRRVPTGSDAPPQ